MADLERATPVKPGKPAKQRRCRRSLIVLLLVAVLVALWTALFSARRGEQQLDMRTNAVPTISFVVMPNSRLNFAGHPREKSVAALPTEMPCLGKVFSASSITNYDSVLWYNAQNPPHKASTSNLANGQLPLLEGMLRERWMGAFEAKVIQYSPWSAQTRTAIDGSKRFIVRFSAGRATRPSTIKHEGHQGSAVMPVEIPFSSDSVNFHRLNAGQLLFAFGITSPKGPRGGSFVQCVRYDSAAAEEPGPSGIRLHQGRHTGPLHAVFANQYPISPYSSLLVPFLLEKRPQVLTEDALRVLLHFEAEFSLSGWRFGFNSLGGGASVNHLHFQFTHLDKQSAMSLPVERCPTKAVKRARVGPQLWRVQGWPVPALLYKGLQDIEKTAQTIAQCVAHLRALGLPHTLLLAGDKAYLFPRRPMTLQDNPSFGGGSPGLMELSGEYILSSAVKFKTVKAQQIHEYLEQTVAVSEKQFDSILNHCATFVEDRSTGDDASQ